MLAASDTIAEYVGRGRDAFDRDQSLRDAIVYQIIILGEAAKAVIQADPTVVWSTAERDVPQIRTRLAAALERLT
jgi:uncharacterized protein with HEPN domain